MSTEPLPMSSRTIRPELLEQRISENAASQQIDLTSWIFGRINVRSETNVLELCCGTGGQTLQFAKIIKESGSLVALDVSQSALDVLASRLDATHHRPVFVEANLDDFGQALLEKGLPRSSFDLIFCAYGLYYAKDTARTLEEAYSWLKPEGKMVIVGPYGPNNGPLFDLVRTSGVAIPRPVIFSSESFMFEAVIPWATRRFSRVNISTMVNPVRWTTPERVLNYWQNTTFYDPQSRQRFATLLDQHFDQYSEFVNEKWVMMVEMANARA